MIWLKYLYFLVSVSCNESQFGECNQPHSKTICSATDCNVFHIFFFESCDFIAKHRFKLVFVFKSLEIKWSDDDSDRMLYVSFRNESERDAFYDQTIQQSCVKITQTEPESMTLKWQNGIISNYDYLLYLNR